MSVFDDAGHILTPEEILILCETEIGKNQVKQYIMRARVAYATMSLMDCLGVVPPAEKQQECCTVLWEVLFRVPIDAVMQWIDELGKFKEDNPDEFLTRPLC
jgi:hypothetical protein